MFELSKFYIARDSWANSENAHFWVQKAAAGGHTKAMDTVGFALFMGWREFGGLNESLAIEYMTKAAEDNNAQSADILGECYIYGWGVEKNYDKAKKYLEIAAKNGSTNAKQKQIHFEEIIKEDGNKLLSKYREFYN